MPEEIVAGLAEKHIAIVAEPGVLPLADRDQTSGDCEVSRQELLGLSRPGVLPDTPRPTQTLPLKGNGMQRTAIVVPLLSLLAGGALADTVFTPASGPKCKDRSNEGFGLWTCPGPAGYAVRFADEGNVVTLTIARARSIEKALPTKQWQGAGKAFGDKVQWIMRAGKPRAAVIRTWRRKDGDGETEIEELSIFAIEGGRACAYGAVDIHQPLANDAALAQAEQAAEQRCSKK